MNDQVKAEKNSGGEATECLSPTQDSRYFTNHRGRFVDGTAYLQSRDGGIVLVLQDGTEVDGGTWTLDDCVTMVKNKRLKEITSDEAAALISDNVPATEG